jgi:hypothetical protein
MSDSRLAFIPFTKTFTALILLAISFNASALRCRSVLINVGSTLKVFKIYF